MRRQRADYSFISNARFVFSVQRKNCGMSLLLLLLSVPVALGITLCEMMLPKTAVAQFVNGSSLENALLSVAYWCAILIVLKWIRQMIETLNFSHLTNLKNHFVCMRMQKSLKTAYMNIESADFRNLMKRADETTAGSGYGSPVERMSKDSIGLLTSVLSYLMLGSILLYANPLITLEGKNTVSLPVRNCWTDLKPPTMLGKTIWRCTPACVKFYDREIELCADYRPKQIVCPEDAWQSVTNIQNVYAGNAAHV